MLNLNANQFDTCTVCKEMTAADVINHSDTFMFIWRRPAFNIGSIFTSQLTSSYNKLRYNSIMNNGPQASWTVFLLMNHFHWRDSN